MFTELLPETKSEKHGAISWESFTTDDSPVAGVLTTTGKRYHCRYLVSESPASEPGRSFTLRKSAADGGGFYSCFVAEQGGVNACDCRGFASTGGCRHLASLQLLIENGQL